MKKFAEIVLSIILLVNCLAVTAFADENQGGSQPIIPTIDARIELTSVNNTSPSFETTVYAGSRMDVRFRIVTGDLGGELIASVTGNGFTMYGTSATQYVGNYVGEDVTIPVKVDSSLETGRYSFTLNVDYFHNGASATLSQNINVNVVGGTGFDLPEQDETDGYVGLEITSAPTESVNAGDTFDVGFSTTLYDIFAYNNTWGISGRVNGTVTVSGEGFTLAGALAEETISAGAASIEVLADKNMTTGRKLLTVSVEFIVDGKSYKASRNINVDVIGEEVEEEVDESGNKASFSLVDAYIPEVKGRSNLLTTLHMEFTNNTEYEATDLKIRLSGLGDIILNSFTDTLECGNVLPGKSIKANFPIKFPEYPSLQTAVTVELTFTSPAGEQTETMNVYLQAIEKPKEEDEPEGETAALTPKVIVKSYSVDPEEVLSGEEFTLTFILENTSAEKDLRNMTVNVVPQAYSSGANGTSSGPVFSFVDGTSSFYTDLLEKSGEVEYSLKLKCSATAGAGTYPIEINFNFEYAQGSGYASGNGEISINLPVTQPIKFDLMDWTPPTECGPDGVMISFQYFNKSKNPMSALGISVEGDFSMDTQYPGSLAASSYDYFEGTMVPVDPTAVGETKTAILVFTFEDSAGAEKRIEKPFEVKIVEESTMGGMGDDMMMGGIMEGGDMSWNVVGPEMPGGDIQYDENGNPVSGEGVDQSGVLPLWAKIAIPAAAALIVIIVIVVIVKKVKAKRELEDEDDA